MHSLQQVAAELKGLSKAVILSHVSPDGDCSGSMLALGMALQGLGIQVTMVNPDLLPRYLSFLPLADRVIQPNQVKHWPHTVICVDCSDRARLGEEIQPCLTGKNIINIDHHISNTGFGSINYVDSQAAATGVIIAQLLDELKVEVDIDMATALYTAIVTDTGSFQYSNTDASTHLLAARLINTGIEVAGINQKLFDTKELPEVKLFGRALNTLEVSADGKLAWVSIPRTVLEELGAKDEHSEGLINFTRALDTVEVGMLFRELTSGKIKVGFRSKQFVDVNKLAAIFGGGGHVRASGCTLNTGLDEAVATVVNKAKEFVEAANEWDN